MSETPESRTPATVFFSFFLALGQTSSLRCGPSHVGHVYVDMIDRWTSSGQPAS